MIKTGPSSSSTAPPAARRSQRARRHLLAERLLAARGTGRDDPSYIGSAGLPLPQVGCAIAALIQVGGALALVMGDRTRIVPAILVALAIVTAFAFHRDLADQGRFVNFLEEHCVGGRHAQPRCAPLSVTWA